MILGVIVTGAVGIVCAVLGVLLWKKEKINILHDYHRENIREEDKKAFCTLSGIGLLIAGAGLIVTAILLWCTEKASSFIVFAVAFAAGLALLITAGVRYNR
ncbi:MAG: DUF3784 domain-containing protein [Lachnospiraceae bacterium]|nr:DUF3784 domain-containing protein [Lachnospiraceae bacterium]